MIISIFCMIIGACILLGSLFFGYVFIEEFILGSSLFEMLNNDFFYLFLLVIFFGLIGFGGFSLLSFGFKRLFKKESEIKISKATDSKKKNTKNKTDSTKTICIIIIIIGLCITICPVSILRLAYIGSGSRLERDILIVIFSSPGIIMLIVGFGGLVTNFKNSLPKEELCYTEDEINIPEQTTPKPEPINEKYEQIEFKDL